MPCMPFMRAMGSWSLHLIVTEPSGSRSMAVSTFMPVETAIDRDPDGSVTIWCSDHDPMARMKGMHGICLHPGKAYVELKVRLYNRTLQTRTFLWWANVAT